MKDFHSIEKTLEFISSQLQAIHLPSKQTLGTVEAAAYLGIKVSTLYKHTSSGSIPYYKPNGKLMRFKVEDLATWLESRRIPSNDELKLEYPHNHNYSNSNFKKCTKN